MDILLPLRLKQYYQLKAWVWLGRTLKKGIGVHKLFITGVAVWGKRSK